MVLTLPEVMKGKVFYRYVFQQGLSVGVIHHRKVNVYVSRQLKPHEMKYLTHDLELSAGDFSLKIWRPCL